MMWNVCESDDSFNLCSSAHREKAWIKSKSIIYFQNTVCEHTHTHTKKILNNCNLAHDVTTFRFHGQIDSRQLSHFNVGFKIMFLLKCREKFHCLWLVAWHHFLSPFAVDDFSEESSFYEILPCCARFRCADLITEGQWHHLVLVMSKGMLKNSMATLYIDGQMVSTVKVWPSSWCRHLYFVSTKVMGNSAIIIFSAAETSLFSALF